MHDEPRRILCQLLAQYGVALHTDPRRTEALLRDLAPGYPREIFVLIHAQRQRIAADLLAAPQWLPEHALHAQLVRRLEENLALTPPAAAWAVATWAEALHPQPTRADRVWGWWRQRMSVGNKVANWGGLEWRQIGRSGVQCVFETLLSLWRTLAAAGQWLWRRRLGLANTPLLVTFALAFSLLVVGSGAAPNATGESTPTLHSRWLLDAYPLPRAAHVSAGPLTVRSGPSTATTPLGLLPVEQEVQVTAFSDDGEWSQIQAPGPGWVNNRYLHFHSEGSTLSGASAVVTVDTVLALAAGRVYSALANVYDAPDPEAAVIARLAAGSELVVVATAVNGPWYEIASPIHGWVRTDMIELNQETNDS